MEHPKQPIPIPGPYLQPPNEISLIDLWLVLVRRRRVLLITLAACTALALILALIKPRVYNYSTSIEIGTLVDENAGTRLIEPPDTVIAKLQEGYIPLTLHEYAEQHPDDATQYRIRARLPKASSLIVVEGTGTEAAGETYRQLINNVVARLVADHDRSVSEERRRLEQQIQEARLKLEALQDETNQNAKRAALEAELAATRTQLESFTDPQMVKLQQLRLENKLEEARTQLANLKEEHELLTSRRKRLDDTEALLKKQIEGLQNQINTSLNHRQSALQEAQTEPQAMTLLLIDSEIGRNRERLAHLEERLHVDIKNERQELDKQLVGNLGQQEVQRQAVELAAQELEKHQIELRQGREQFEPKVTEARLQIDWLLANQRRDIARQELEIATLKDTLESIRRTRALAPAMRSLKPTGSSRALILALGMVLGLMLGVFAAFFAEFLYKARREAAYKQKMETSQA
ncbi:MAG: Wzz/FepE/Etk N-terminal domain-containing protein [Pseudomonadota bacterium]|nr:Wzz/FepE/Etk N-terminal domain-containing protein [Pseudomonadota bacterium]